MIFTIVGSIISYILLKPLLHDIIVLASLSYNSRFQIPTDIPADIPSDPVYVALGSSFAAGPSVGDPVQQSLGYLQGTLGYPMQLASKLNITQFVNAASSGQLLSKVGETQLKYLGPNTKLVTLTAGGNDVNYSRDSIFVYYKHMLESSIMRRLMEWYVPLSPVESRNFDQVRRDFSSVIRQIKERSPDALIIVVSYVTIMPPNQLPPLTKSETELLRGVGEKLAQITRECSTEGALVVDMASISKDHHVLSDDPWAVGYKPPGFLAHPNLKGHTQCANFIYQAIQRTSPHLISPKSSA